MKDVKGSMMHPTVFEFLNALLNKNSKVLEIGSGRSTIWFADKVRHITSYEHIEFWHNFVDTKLKEANLTNYKLILDPDYPKNGIQGLDGQEFDLVLMDGRGRILNTEIAMNHVKEDGYFVFDDAQRGRYKKIHTLFNDWNTVAELRNHKRLTIIWKKVGRY